jgi:hypothetical protein
MFSRLWLWSHPHGLWRRVALWKWTEVSEVRRIALMMQYAPLKRRSTSTSLYRVISQKSVTILQYPSVPYFNNYPTDYVTTLFQLLSLCSIERAIWGWLWLTFVTYFEYYRIPTRCGGINSLFCDRAAALSCIPSHLNSRESERSFPFINIISHHHLSSRFVFRECSRLLFRCPVVVGTFCGPVYWTSESHTHWASPCSVTVWFNVECLHSWSSNKHGER